MPYYGFKNIDEYFEPRRGHFAWREGGGGVYFQREYRGGGGRRRKISNMGHVLIVNSRPSSLECGPNLACI